MNCNIASLLMGDPKAFFSSDLVSGSRRDNVSMVRALIAYLAVREMRYSGSEVGRILGLSEPGIMKCVDRGKRMLNDDSELRGKLREPLIIPNLSLPPRIKYGVNSGGSPVISKTYGFLLSQE
jgi:hypothetical protein